jgi:Nuclease-related domain
VPDGPIESFSADSDDLSLNVPGATLREKSAEIKRAYPVRVALAKVLRMHNAERAWRRGAMGEEEVAKRLRSLGDEWRIIHSVPIGANDTDIDHVVIGPPGVFTLNTKNHLGKRVTVYERAIYVSGTKQSYILKSRAEGRHSSKLLSAACGFDVPVTPVVVIMASELNIKGQPGDVVVIGRKQIVRWLSEQPPRCEPLRVAAIFAAARQRGVWQV